MPITFAQIATNTASITLTVGEHSVTVVYYPGRFTEKTVATLELMAENETGKTSANFHAWNEMFCTLIKSWDVLENDGETMFPLDPLRIAELPISFRADIVNAIIADIRPEAGAAQPSLNGHS